MENAERTNLRKLSFLGFGRRTGKNNDGNSGSNSTDVYLDEECAKVFAMDTEHRDKFDLNKLHETNVSNEPRNYGENEYSLHRKKSYPHMHAPLKVSKSSKRRSSSTHTTATGSPAETPLPGTPSSTTGPPSSFATATATPSSYPSPILQVTDSDTGVVSSLTIVDDESGSESEGILSDPSGYRTHEYSPEKKVQFISGRIPEDGSVANTDDKKQKKSRHHYPHYSKFRKYSLPDDPSQRKRHHHHHHHHHHNVLAEGFNKGRRISTQPEDLPLGDQDRDHLDSHRSDDPRALRRHRTSRPSNASLVHIGRGEQLAAGFFKKMYDHSPHAIFVELDEIFEEQDEREWKETARWIKYEEDVEEGVDRWGKPHVASLSFHSLLNLRKCLEDGLVCLDMEERDLPAIAYRISEELYKEDLIREEDKAKIMRILLLRHRHVNEHHDHKFKFYKKHSYSSLQSLWFEDAAGYDAMMMARCSVCSAQGSLCPPHMLPRHSIISYHNLHDGEKRKSADLGNGLKNGGHSIDADGKLLPGDTHAIDIKEELYTASTEDLKKFQNDTILKRIPVGAQGSSVLVGSVDFLEQPAIAFIRLAEGVVIPSLIEVNLPVRFIFLLLGPREAKLDYHEVGRSISTLMANQQFHNIAYSADNRKALLSAINDFLDDSIVLPPGDWERQALLPIEEIKAKSQAIRKRKENALKKVHGAESKPLLSAGGDGDGKKPPFPNPLERTKKPFGGLINDLRRRFPLYKSDIVDGLNAQCSAAAIFMYFAALSGAITFGGLMSDKTDNYIGISETLVATSVAGVIFALFSGQPLVIVGSTGPLLLFDESLYQFCKANGIEYLTTRVYIGIWLGIIALFVASLEGSVFVKLFTRFTEEIFSALISLLYIVESVMKLVFVFGKHPLMQEYCDSDLMTGLADNSLLNGNYTEDSSENYTEIATTQSSMTMAYFKPTNQPNTALFCTILALGTFAIAYYLRLFRNSQFLGRNARRALGDFGVPIAIVIMVVLDYMVPETYTEKLSVPEGLSPSNPEVRGWLIDPSGSNEPFPLWVVAAACIPAMLVYILLFMETHICELIMDKKERKLKKGSGFHLDIVLVCLINVGCGFLGTPWICAATVRSVAHISAVTVMSRTHAPGEKPHIIEVKEQRVSALTVSILVGLSVLMAPLLRLVPMSVLFGVFLYMGVSSTDGIQFFDRMKLFFMPVKHHPQASYVRRVKTAKMHLFTFIQLMCLVVLWVVKSTKASLAFPFFLLLMVPFRAQLKYLFSPIELRALDGDQPDVDDDEPDFYAEAPLPG
ncbi:PREDICTED: band 3 anion transport protein isoform X2 [Nicrophorus vespilloides]|uniref:Anion exchange protein n=1 Tax=Nicrophorus vespilloides TaxID=110193 RepID=A0ABM1MFD9_NICVS|nr:PREDICTED: band 3 anion transport protein isoform X2 [Nicrophorus vespilloides]